MTALTILTLSPQLANACGCDWMIQYTASDTDYVKAAKANAQKILDEKVIDYSLEFNWPGSPMRQGGSDVMLCNGTYVLKYIRNDGKVCRTQVATNQEHAFAKRTHCKDANTGAVEAQD